MRILCCFFAIFLLPFIAFTQDKFDYVVSTPYRVIDGQEKYYLSSFDDQKVLSIKRDGKDLYMQVFDAKKMKELKRNKFTDMPKGFVLESVDWFEDRAFCYFSVWDKKNTTEQLYVREVDFDNCGFKGSERRLIAVQGKLTGAPLVSVGYWSVGTIDKFSFLYSKDRTKLLIQCRKKPEIKRDAINHDIIGMYVFDKDLNELAANEVKMPYTEKKMDNIDYHIDSEGIPYILAKVRKDNTTKETAKDKTANYVIELLKVDIKNKKIKITQISVEDYYMKDMWLYEGTDNMICSGFYNKKPSTGWVWGNVTSDGNADGLFLFKLDKDGGINEKKFYEIPLEIINQYTRAGAQKRNEKKDKKGKAVLSNLGLEKMIIQEDNSIILIGEQYYRVYHRTSRSSYYTYHYDDMLITKIDSEGNLAWMRKLPKKTYSRQQRGGLGFEHIALGDDHCLLFLDNVKNMELGLDKRPATHVDGLGGFLTAYRINDETGKVNKVSVFDTKDVKGDIKVYQFNTGRILQMSDNEIIMELYKKEKEDVMIKIMMK